MPKYRVTGPDGRSYEVTAPDGASEADVMAYVQSNASGGMIPEGQRARAKPGGEVRNGQFVNSVGRTPTADPARVNEEAVGGMSTLGRLASGYGKAYTDTWLGLRQLTGNASTEEVDDKRKTDAALSSTPAGLIGNFGGVAAQFLTPGSSAVKVASASTKGAPILNAAAQGGAFGAIQPVATGETRGGNAATAGAFGAAGGALAPVLGRIGTRAAEAIKPEVRALWEAAKARGITLTPAQLSDSRFLKYLESQMRSLPLSGAGKKAAEQKAVFNQRVAESIGSEKPVVTPEVYADIKSLQGKQFEALTSRNDLRVSRPLIDRLEAIAKEADIAGGDVAAAVRAAIDDFYSRTTTGPGGIIVPGKAYQALDTTLGKTTKLGTPVSAFVGNVKSAIREAMDDSISPKDRQAWNLLRQQYGNRKTIRDLVAKGDGGELSPAALMGRVTANNYGKEAMASGSRGELGELARIGQRIKEPPSSGTSERQLANSVLLPWNAVATVARSLIGGTAGRAVNSNGLAALMMRDSRGKPLQGLARLLEQTQAGRAVPAAAVTANNKRKPKAKD